MPHEPNTFTSTPNVLKSEYILKKIDDTIQHVHL